jgi:hypothetical protein
MLKRIVLISFLLLLSGVANADCWYEGVKHREGAIIGPYVCARGKWATR